MLQYMAIQYGMPDSKSIPAALLYMLIPYEPSRMTCSRWGSAALSPVTSAPTVVDVAASAIFVAHSLGRASIVVGIGKDY